MAAAFALVEHDSVFYNRLLRQESSRLACAGFLLRPSPEFELDTSPDSCPVPALAHTVHGCFPTRVGSCGCRRAGFAHCRNKSQNLQNRVIKFPGFLLVIIKKPYPTMPDVADSPEKCVGPAQKQNRINKADLVNFAL